MEVDYQIIDTTSGLEKAVSVLKKKTAIAVDLEADSMYHFKEKVCLVQIATDTISLVIDPLAMKDLSLLEPIFSNPEIKKIFHGADYDVRSLYRDFKIKINSLFDTELACRFLGIKETGLKTILQTFFKVVIDKKYQKKDWSKRPLPEEMIAYASKDVIYLLPLARMLIHMLEEKGRLTWVLEECDDLRKVRPVLSNEAPLFLKFKGAGKLTSRSLAVLEALLQFRKRVAEKKDKPFFKIIGNSSIMKITAAEPETLRRLADIQALNERQISMYGHELVSVVSEALKLSETEIPVYPRKTVSTMPFRVSKRLKALKFWRASKASALGLDPGMLCNNALITSIAYKNPGDRDSIESIKEMKSWQKEEFGDEIVRVLSKGI